MKTESRILVRIPEELHQKLKEIAAESRRSLNSVCTLALEAAAAEESGPSQPGAQGASRRTTGISVAIEPIVEEFQEELEGIVLFGSEARGDATAGSDTDLLLVMKPDFALDRDVYKRWDRFAAGAGLPERLSPHFCRMPESWEDAGGLWFETALEGIVLWERDFVVSRSLSRLRTFMLEHNLQRKFSYGIPYWVRINAKQETRG